METRRNHDAGRPGCGYNIVPLPWSLKVSASDFPLVKSALAISIRRCSDSPCAGEPHESPTQPRPFFEFAPRVSLNPGNVSALLSLACAEFGMIDAVIFAQACRTAARGQRPGIRPRRVRDEVPDRRRTAPSKGWRLRWQLSPLRCSNAGRLAATSAGQAPPLVPRPEETASVPPHLLAPGVPPSSRHFLLDGSVAAMLSSACFLAIFGHGLTTQ